jgi:hypothetical protein
MRATLQFRGRITYDSIPQTLWIGSSTTQFTLKYVSHRTAFIRDKPAPDRQSSIASLGPLRQMERPLALLDGDVHLLPHRFQARVVRQLQVVDACHDRRQVVVRRVRRLTRLADNSEHGRERLEACKQSAHVREQGTETNLQWAALGFQ